VLPSVLRPAFIGASIAWALALPLAPWIAAQPHPRPLTVASLYAVYILGSGICHQIPERSIHLWGHQMPVCARCAGIYLGAAIAAVCSLAVASRARAAREWRAILAAAAMPAAISLLYEWTSGDMPSHWLRAATGLPLGAAIAATVVSAFAPVRLDANQ